MELWRSATGVLRCVDGVVMVSYMQGNTRMRDAGDSGRLKRLVHAGCKWSWMRVEVEPMLKATISAVRRGPDPAHLLILTQGHSVPLAPARWSVDA
jgi:hypothetical protein